MYARGQRHWMVKHPDSLVREVRRVWHEWKKAGSRKGYTEIAAAFGVSMWTAREWVNYRTRIDV